jgi:hypothetical protein
MIALSYAPSTNASSCYGTLTAIDDAVEWQAVVTDDYIANMDPKAQISKVHGNLAKMITHRYITKYVKDKLVVCFITDFAEYEFEFTLKNMTIAELTQEIALLKMPHICIEMPKWDTISEKIRAMYDKMPVNLESVTNGFHFTSWLDYQYNVERMGLVSIGMRTDDNFINPKFKHLTASKKYRYHYTVTRSDSKSQSGVIPKSHSGHPLVDLIVSYIIKSTF